jgi:hypothetical protein
MPAPAPAPPAAPAPALLPDPPTAAAARRPPCRAAGLPSSTSWTPLLPLLVPSTRLPAAAAAGLPDGSLGMQSCRACSTQPTRLGGQAPRSPPPAATSLAGGAPPAAPAPLCRSQPSPIELWLPQKQPPSPLDPRPPSRRSSLLISSFAVQADSASSQPLGAWRLRGLARTRGLAAVSGWRSDEAESVSHAAAVRDCSVQLWISPGLLDQEVHQVHIPQPPVQGATSVRAAAVAVRAHRVGSDAAANSPWLSQTGDCGLSWYGIAPTIL